MRPLPLILALLAGLSACSSDAPTAATTTTTTGAATSSTGISIIVDTTTNNDTVVVGSSIPVRIHVMQGTVAVSNVFVTWAVTAGGGSLSAASSFTDSTGLATITWRLSDSVATNTLSASITGATTTFVETAIAGPASAVTRVSPDSQAVVAGGSLPIIARVVDREGNASAGAAVVWTTTGGTLSVSSSVSGASGNATTNLTTDVPGVYLVTASVAGEASVTFRVVAF